MYTYQEETQVDLYETYEWDNTWHEHANDHTTPRILYIGDSISCEVRRCLNEHGQGSFRCDGYGSSRAIDDPFFQAQLLLFAQQQGYRNVILFNNGLHGWHLGEEAYELAYENMVKFLLRTFPSTPIVLLLSTNVVADQNRTKILIQRNHIVEKLAAKYHCPVIDLFSCSNQINNLYAPDGVHFSKQGYNRLSQPILSWLNNHLFGTEFQQ